MPRTSVISAFINDNASGVVGPDGTQYYVELTIQSSQVSSDLTDFPVYVDLSTLPSAFFTNVQSDGGDIRVTESDGVTRCPVDLVSINTSASTGELHFLAPSLSSSSDTAFRVYYGTTDTSSQPGVATTYGRNAVWSEYKMVWHGSAATDSTGNASLSANGVTPGDATGQIGSGTTWDSLTDAISSAASINATGGALSVSWWQNKSDGGSATMRVFSLGNIGVFLDFLNSAWRFIEFRATTDRQVATPNNTITNSSWQHYVVTYDGVDENGVAWYEAGASLSPNIVNSGAGALDSEGSLIIGNFDGADRGYSGVLDEVRIQSSELPADWIAAEYTNQNTPTTFYTVGSQTTV